MRLKLKHNWFVILCFMLTSCEHAQLVEYGATENATIKVVLQTEGISKISDVSFKAYDINMNKDYKSDTLMLTIPLGYYDLSITAKGDGHPIRAYKRGVAVREDISVELTVDFMHEGNNNFVLAEIFFAGTETPEGKRYLGDKYFVIFNNSPDTLAADGLILIEADLNSVQKYDLGAYDFRDKYFAVDAMYRIPGDGSTYRVAPGKVLIIADNAMNHIDANINSFDLSMADFEWYDVSSSAGIADVDNPDVPNMDKLYCYTYTIWVPHNQGHKSYGLARFPDDMTAEKYFATADYYISYKYELVTAAGTFSQSKKSYVLPNEWIVDAVNLAPYETFQWLTISDKLDAGYTYVAPTGSDETRFGKSVRRRSVGTINGRRILQDTNNSTEDFEPAVQADPFYFK